MKKNHFVLGTFALSHFLGANHSDQSHLKAIDIQKEGVFKSDEASKYKEFQNYLIDLQSKLDTTIMPAPGKFRIPHNELIHFNRAVLKSSLNPIILEQDDDNTLIAVAKHQNGHVKGITFLDSNDEFSQMIDFESIQIDRPRPIIDEITEEKIFKKPETKVQGITIGYDGMVR